MVIDVVGSERVIKTINDFVKKMESDDLKRYIGSKAIEVINEEAFNELGDATEYTKHNKMEILSDGILIYNDVKNTEGQYYSLMVEYGTGVYAVMENIGTTEMFEKSGHVFWYVPAEKAPKLENYAYEKVTTDEGSVLYKVYGQYPNYIYTNSATKIRKNLSKWVKEYIFDLMK